MREAKQSTSGKTGLVLVLKPSFTGMDSYCCLNVHAVYYIRAIDRSHTLRPLGTGLMPGISAHGAVIQLEVVIWRRSHIPVIGKKKITVGIGIGFTTPGMVRKSREVAKVTLIVPTALSQFNARFS